MLKYFRKIFSPTEKPPQGNISPEPGKEFSAPTNLPEASEAHKKAGDAHLHKGEWTDAARCYRQAISINPDYAAAYCNLGYAQSEQGLYEEAERNLKQSIAINPVLAHAYCFLGSISQKQGNLDAAINFYQKAIEVKPDFEIVYRDLCLVLFRQGQIENARQVILKGISLNPDFADYHYFLGNLYGSEGAFGKAVDCYQRALAIQPEYVQVHFNLGNMFKEQGKLDEAQACYRKVLFLKPDYAEAHFKMGNLLNDIGQVDGAVASYRRALELQPDLAWAHCTLGNFLKGLGQLDAAAASYRRVLEIEPDSAEAHSNLGNALRDIGQLDGAVASFRRALEIKPDFAEAHINLGIAQKILGQLDDAMASYRLALEIKPDVAEAYYNLSNALQDLGQLDSALESYRRALELKPDYVEALDNMLFALNYHPDLGAEEIYQAYKKYDTQRGIPLRSTWRAHNNDRNPDRRLRIGYVSPDFRLHSCSSFLEPLLAHHDKSQVEVYAYAELTKEDEVTTRYKSYADHWTPTKGMNDEVLAEHIRSDGIDILVELAGHTGSNRLLAFARKPAPVSLSWLGYGYTTGLSAIDYYLTDEVCVPAGSEGLFSEQPWRIATPTYTYRPNPGMGEVGSLPALRRGHITFGTLTRAVRINHRTIRAWSELLKAVPDSRLVMDSLSFKAPAMQERMAARFAEHGISRERLEIGYHSPPWDVLRGIDIGLDCFPHNSGTTLFETLYMGVPYITLAGRPSVGRLGSSILQGAGHPEWIAGSEEEYVDKAAGLARDLERLAAQRASLRTEMENSPLLDEAGFARKVEAAYREMFEKWAVH
jgi:predicted O-linked N-acetylglucosamine transferase (SPINDLY family)